MPIIAQVLGSEALQVYCSGVRPAGDAGLKCRFGSGPSALEVPAQADTNGISCCPSLQGLRSDLGAQQSMPVRVFQHDRMIVEDVITAQQLLLPSGQLPSSSPAPVAAACAGSACCPPQQPQPPRRDDTEASSAAAAAVAAGIGADVELTQSPAGGALEEPAAGGKAQETRVEALKRNFSALRPFVIISLSYLLFTTTDGAIRMIVLLHAYNSGFTAWEVAIMFTLYELMGVVTNLAAGMMGAKWGIKWTLLSGLTLQLAGISVLYGWQDDWKGDDKWKGIVFVTFAQMLCGIAKDLTKLGGKTVTKLVTKDEQQSKLFKLVSFITGFKNSLKGIGYFIGAASVSFSYEFALAVLLVLIVAAMPWAAIGLSSDIGRTRKENLTLQRIFKQNYNISVLSISRFFLFGSRDMWFEVPLPFFLRDKTYGLGWSRPLTGLFLALWIIVYGQVQSWTPQFVLGPLRQMPANKYVAVLWNGLLVATPLFMGIMVQAGGMFKERDVDGMAGVMIGGLGAFCLLFAVNSSIHSYLIVRYAEGDKVAMNVGFYYMANAVGRLTGTLVSGALYSYAGDNLVQGFAACFWASLGFCILSALVEVFLNDNGAGLMCGGVTVVPPDASAPQGPRVEVEVE